MMQSMAIKELTRTALMLAVIIVLGLFPGLPVGFLPVPIVLQNFGIMLAGEVLGAKQGTLAAGLFLVLVALGFPFLSGGHGGMASLFGPTGGALLAWAVAPLAIGLTLQHAWFTATWWREWLVVLVFGVGLINLAEVVWLATFFHFGFGQALVAELVFLPGDVLKATLSVIVARRLRKIWAVR